MPTLTTLDADIQRALAARLIDLRRAISDALLSNPNGFEAARLNDLLDTIEQLLDAFEGNMIRSALDIYRSAYALGVSGVVDPLTVAGIPGIDPTLPPQQLTAALDFSAALVQSITDQMRGSINTTVRLAVLGGQSPFEAMKAITAMLGLDDRRRVVRGVGVRGERILRTEMTTVYNLAHQTKMSEIAGLVPGLLKAWVATPDTRTRPSHLAAHRRYSDEPIPVGQPFIVGGFEAMFPGDPNLPASERINCRCTQRTIIPGITPGDNPLDKAIDREAKKRQ